nr:hypothetical protein [Kofleriaceae bacterium]
MTAGYRLLDGPVHAIYPCDAPARSEAFGDRAYPLDVARDAPVMGTRLPVVAISPGTGSTPWLFRHLAAALASAGYVALLVEHPGNRRGDDALAGTAQNLANRPRHVRAAVDAALADALLGPHVGDRAAVIGHSLGAYTALAVVGGQPTAMPAETSGGLAGERVPVDRDARVVAAVLLMPALFWFAPSGALDGVHVPLMVRAGERDALVPPFAVDQILRGLPADTARDLAVVANAGHFSCCSPFPAALVSPAIPPSLDPPGFDRAAYLEVLHAEIVAFLRRWLG